MKEEVQELRTLFKIFTQALQTCDEDNSGIIHLSVLVDLMDKQLHKLLDF